MSRARLTISETLALSAGIANEGGLSDAQCERISKWAAKVRRDNATLDAIIRGDANVTIPASESEPLKFDLTEQGKAKAEASVRRTREYIATFFGSAPKKEEPKPEPAPHPAKPDLNRFLRDFLDSLFGPQTIEKIDNNKKEGA